MSGSVNKAIIVGSLGRDPEVRYTQSNQKIANLSVATSERWKDKATGEAKEKTEWHRVVVFNENLADVAERYLTKGSKVYLEGSLQTRKWTDQSGAEKYTTEIVLQRFRGELVLLGGGGDAPEPRRQAPRQDYAQRDSYRPPAGGGADLDTEIPFRMCWEV